MALDFSSDLPFFFGDFGATLVYGNQAPVAALFDDSSMPMSGLGGSISSMEKRQYKVQFPASALNPAPKPKDVVTVDGRAYTVKARDYMGDGRIMQLELSA